MEWRELTHREQGKAKLISSYPRLAFLFAYQSSEQDRLGGHLGPIRSRHPPNLRGDHQDRPAKFLALSLSLKFLVALSGRRSYELSS